MALEAFEFLHWDPDGRLRRFLDRWFPPSRLSLGGDDTYRTSRIGGQGPDVQWPQHWGTLLHYDGPYLLSDPEVGLPRMPWPMRPPQWLVNSLWVPTGASRTAIGLFLSDQQKEPGSWVDFRVYPEGNHPVWKLYVLAQLPFTEGQGNQSWLTILVDRRYFDRDQPLVLPQEKAIRPDDLLPQDLIDALPQRDRIRPTDLSQLAAAGPLNAYVWLQQWPAGLVLDALAACARLRVVFDLHTEQYVLQSTLEAGEVLQNNLLAIDPIAHFLPTPAPKIEKIIVSFPIAVRRNYKWTEAGPTYSLDTLHPRRLRQSREWSIDNSGPGRRIAAWTSCPMLYEAVASGVPPSPDRAEDYVYGDEPINGDVIGSVLDRIRGYYLDWVQNARLYHFSLPMTCQWNLTGFDDSLWVQYDQQGKQYHPKQIVSSLPPDCFPTEWPFGQLSPGRSPSTSFWAFITGAQEVVQDQQWVYTCQPNDPNAEGVPPTFEARNVLEHSGDWWKETFFPIPLGTQVRVWKTEWIEQGQLHIKYWFSYPLRPKGVSPDLYLLGIQPGNPGYYYVHHCSFYKGHLFWEEPSEAIPLTELCRGANGGQQSLPGPIEVGGNIVPGDAAGRFFPVPGLWNGMPQWQNAQNPNVWIRWIPLPGGGGRWAIGWWPADAVQGQLPNWGWAHPIPPAGQPPQQNPIAPFPDAIGDVQGEPWTWQHDYVLEDCTTGQRYILVGSASRLWPLNAVIRWRLGNTINCAKVISMWDWRDLPEVENPHIYIYKYYFWTCDECYAIDRVVQDCDGARRFLLEGNSYYQWPTGHVVKWMDPQGQIHCSRILSLQETGYHEKLSVGAWAYLMLLDSCDRCKNDECPSQLSCPSQPSQPWCSPYYACLCASGVILPSSAVGVYPIQSGTVGGKCWWKKGDWIIYFSPGAGTWFLFNLNNPDLYWYRSSSDPVGVYQPHPNHTAGIAFVGKTP